MKIRPDLFTHDRTKGINPEDVTKHRFDLDNDKEIPGVIVCLVTDVRYQSWDGSVVDAGKSVLLMRRSFEVNAYPGLWSMVDGLRDLVVVSDPSAYVSDAALECANVLEEIVEEAGFQVGMISTIEKIGKLWQHNTGKEWQVFDLSIYYAYLKADITPPITLSYEHFGAVWANLNDVRSLLSSSNGCCWGLNPVLEQVFLDKTVPNIPKILSMLVQAI